MKKTHFRFLLSVVFLFIFFFSLSAQVTVSPLTIFLDSKNRFATFLVINGSPMSQEVTLEFKFGYPSSDADGKIYMQFADSQASLKYNMAGFLKAFPKKFIVRSGEQQVVRLTALAQDSLKEGSYWTRLITKSTPQQASIDTGASSGITTNIRFVLEQITTVMYRKGTVMTSITIDSIFALTDTLGTHVVAKLHQGGNSPFLGKVAVKVWDPKGNQIFETMEYISAYFNSAKSFLVKDSKLPAGVYTTEWEITSDRIDIPVEYILPATPIRVKTTFLLR